MGVDLLPCEFVDGWICRWVAMSVSVPTFASSCIVRMKILLDSCESSFQCLDCACVDVGVGEVADVCFHS